jgi:hypothetical protein
MRRSRGPTKKVLFADPVRSLDIRKVSLPQKYKSRRNQLDRPRFSFSALTIMIIDLDPSTYYDDFFTLELHFEAEKLTTHFGVF